MKMDWSKVSFIEFDFLYCYGIGESGFMEMFFKLIDLRYFQLFFCGWGRVFSDNVISVML